MRRSNTQPESRARTDTAGGGVVSLGEAAKTGTWWWTPSCASAAEGLRIADASVMPTIPAQHQRHLHHDRGVPRESPYRTADITPQPSVQTSLRSVPSRDGSPRPSGLPTSQGRCGYPTLNGERSSPAGGANGALPRTLIEADRTLRARSRRSVREHGALRGLPRYVRRQSRTHI